MDPTTSTNMELETFEENLPTTSTLPPQATTIPNWMLNEVTSVVNLFKTNYNRILQRQTTISNLTKTDETGKLTHHLLKVSLHADLKKYADKDSTYNEKLCTLHVEIQKLIQQHLISTKSEEIKKLQDTNSTCNLLSTAKANISTYVQQASSIKDKDSFINKYEIPIETLLLDELSRAELEFIQKQHKVSFITYTKDTNTYCIEREERSCEARRPSTEETGTAGKTEGNRSSKIATSINPSVFRISQTANTSSSSATNSQETRQKAYKESCKQKELYKKDLGNKTKFFNLTTFSVPPSISSILDKGVKFTPNPYTLTDDLIAQTSTYLDRLHLLFNPKDINHCFNISDNYNVIKDIIMKDYIKKLHSAYRKVRSSDIRKMKTYLHNNNLLLLEADKNLGYVVVTNDWYHEQIMVHLNDTNTYIKEEPKFDLIIKDFKRIFDNCKNINSKLYSRLKMIYRNLNKWDKTPIFHILPKVHKTPVKTRPVIPCINSITADVAKALDTTLQTYIDKFDWVLKGTFDLIHKLEEISMCNFDLIIMSADVESLYTNIDVPSGITYVCGLLLTHDMPKSEVDLVKKLLYWVFNNNYFKFNDVHYKQKRGIAMGSPIAPSFANLVLIYLERFKILSDVCIFTYFRFIDDTFVLLEEKNLEYVQGVFQKLNKHLKWTFVKGKSVPILDLLVKIDDRVKYVDKVSYETYDKSTNLHIYTDPTSHQPEKYTFNWINGENIRLIRTNSSLKTYNIHLTRFKQYLLDRNYPIDIINKQLFYDYDDRQRLLIKHNPKQIKNIILPIENKSFYTLSYDALKDLYDYMLILSNRPAIGINIPIKKGKKVIDAANVVKKHLRLTETTDIDNSKMILPIEALMESKIDHISVLKRRNYDNRHESLKKSKTS